MKKLSIILIDWNVRESFHAIDYLNEQTISREQFEIIWVEYYNHRPEQIRKYYENGFIDKWIVLEKEGMYFKHQMYNEGILASTGEIICVCDSDAVFSPTFVHSVVSTFEEHKDENIVLYLDEVRNANQCFYPFKHRSWDEIMQTPGLINWDFTEEKPSGLTKEYGKEYLRNYGACLCVKKSDIIEAGGFDEHQSYYCFICGPYELGWRLVNNGFKEIWHNKEWLMHVWHPWVNSGESNNEVVGYHDGFGINYTAHELIKNKTVQPLKENIKIKQLRLCDADNQGIQSSDFVQDKIMCNYNSSFINDKYTPQFDETMDLVVEGTQAIIEKVFIVCEDHLEGEKLYRTLKATRLAKYIDVLVYGTYFRDIGKEEMEKTLVNMCRWLSPDLIIFMPIQENSIYRDIVEPSREVFMQIEEMCNTKYLVYLSKRCIVDVGIEKYLEHALANGNIDECNNFFTAVQWIDSDKFTSLDDNKDIDVCFIGSIPKGSFREECINYLRSNGIRVVTRIHRLPEDMYLHTIARTKICLDMPASKTEHELTRNRCAEIMGCNTLLMKYIHQRIPEVFVEKEDYIAFIDKEELLEKVNYYLKHDEERNTISSRAKVKVLLELDSKNVWNNILNKIDFEHKLSPNNVNDIMSLYLDSSKYDQTKETLKKAKNVAIFGASLSGIKCCELLTGLGIDVHYFLDNSEEKQNTKLMGKEVHPVEYLFTCKFENLDAIILGIGSNKKWSLRQLQSIGCNIPIIDKDILLEVCCG